MTTLAEAYAAEGLTPPKAPRGHPEHSLQTQIGRFAREYVACEHEFAAHDRSENRGGTQHLYEKMRFIRAHWPDTELDIDTGATFRCELKWGANKPDAGQQALIDRLNRINHPTSWANSVVGWLREARKFGVPFRPGADAKAAALDVMLLDSERVRKLGVPKKKKRAPRARKEPAQQGALNVMARARTKGVYA